MKPSISQLSFEKKKKKTCTNGAWPKDEKQRHTRKKVNKMENKAGKPEGCVCTYDLRKGIFANVRVKKSLLFYLFYDTPPCLGLEKPFLFY